MPGYRHRFLDPEAQRFALPTYPYGCAPVGYLTRRQLRARGLCPGGAPVAAHVRWMQGRREVVAYLYDLTAARGKRTATPAVLAALGRAFVARCTCSTCGRVAGYVIPRRFGECLDCAEPRHPGRGVTGPWAGRLLDALTALDPVDAPIPFALTPAAHLVIAAPTAADAGHAAGSRPASTNDVLREDLTVTCTPTGYLVLCEVCGLDSDPYSHPEEADQAAAIHDYARHRGQPTAHVADLHHDEATDLLAGGAR